MQGNILKSKFTWIITTAVILGVALILLLRSFNSIKLKTTDDVRAFLVSSGYCESSEVQQGNGAGMHTLAGSSKNNSNIDMIVFYRYDKGEKSAKDTFELCYDSFHDPSIITSEKHGANYTISEVDRADKNYMLIVKADNTMISVSGPRQGKEDVKKLVSELGYYKE
ncbi:hypothetical protein [Ruminococcus sp. HUN007]|uniref:hypothetical protein n=1 Tax=Ruminococcus sp. HUN007 TaxID=1514668 RepID=UPI0005D16AC1|nr:hypothetical protein [Ruminococcus sp. HUN007]